MTGNDIISRSLIQSQNRAHHFACKIMTQTEWDQIENIEDFRTNVYSHWACKEAAYKIDRKKGHPQKLNPKQYEVAWDGNGIRVISKFSGCIYTGSIEISDRYIHAVVCEKGEQVKSHVFQLPSLKRRVQSQYIKQHISNRLTNGHHTLEKDSSDIPNLKGWNISLSHCGHWGVWSAVTL